MRFTESKKKMPLISIILILVVVGVGFLCFYEPNPKQTTVQKTVTFEAD